MKSNRILLAAALTLILPGICLVGTAQAQEPALRRDVPPPVAFECSHNAAAADTRAGALQDPTEAARLVAAAREAVLLGDPRAARDLLDRAARADSTAPNIAFLFARTLEELGAVSDAVAEYCRYLRLAVDAPDADEVRQRVGRIAPPGRPGIPDSAVALFTAALAFADAGRDTDAEHAFSAVIASAPSWATPYYNRGLLRARTDRRAAAHADFEQFLALEPRGSETPRVRRWLTQLSAPLETYSPGTAFAYGLIPGAGHFYTSRPVAGTALIAVVGAATAVGVLYQTRRVDCLTVPQNGVCPSDQIRAEHIERPYLVPAVGVAAAATILGALDAARGARRHNTRGPALGAATNNLLPAVQISSERFDVALLRLHF
jgi:tetratricopeptide (TPR) repeat protein